MARTKMNKRGIIKIIEASAAMVIIFIVILTITTTRKSATENDLSERITPLLEEIAKNNSLREEIVNYSTIRIPKDIRAIASIEVFLNSSVDKNLRYGFKICEIDEVCGLDEYPKDITGNIYAGSRIISSSLGNATPKKLSLFLWYYK